MGNPPNGGAVRHRCHSPGASHPIRRLRAVHQGRVQCRAWTPAPASPLSPATWSTSTLCWAPTTTSTPTRPTPPSGWRSAPRATAAPASPPPSTRTTSPPPPRRSASTARRRAPTGPLFLGADTHALSEPARDRAGGVRGQRRHRARRRRRRLHPDPGRLARHPEHNRGRTSGLADGIVVTPSHNPPRDGGFKYNPPNGGPADTDATGWIQDRANALIAAGLDGRPAHAVRAGRGPPTPPASTTSSRPTSTTSRRHRPGRDPRAGVRIGADPLGGASVDYWAASPSGTAST